MWCPLKGKFGHRYIGRKDDVKTEGRQPCTSQGERPACVLPSWLSEATTPASTWILDSEPPKPFRENTRVIQPESLLPQESNTGPAPAPSKPWLSSGISHHIQPLVPSFSISLRRQRRPAGRPWLLLMDVESQGPEHGFPAEPPHQPESSRLWYPRPILWLWRFGQTVTSWP